MTDTAHVLTNIPGIHALTAWRRAQPKRLRSWLFRTPGRWTTHGEQ